MLILAGCPGLAGSPGRKRYHVDCVEVIALEFRRIRELREDHDLNQGDVAEYLHMHREVYGRYERGEREIPVWAVIKLAEYYHTSTDYILGLTNKR